MEAMDRRWRARRGCSANLAPGPFTELSGWGDSEPTGASARDRQGSEGGGWSFAGRNLHFGVREHAMGPVVTGLAAHGGTVPVCATFLIVSDYMRPPIRLAALMGLHVIYVFTHDSIALGEDGSTHQPIEQLAGLRSVPRLIVVRPGDANETSVAWRVALETRGRPVALILTRQSVPTPDRTPPSVPPLAEREACTQAMMLRTRPSPAKLYGCSGPAASTVNTSLRAKNWASPPLSTARAIGFVRTCGTVRRVRPAWAWGRAVVGGR